ncbi:MAG: acyloxyacyl hydrolase [Candidatus Omnitrophota bacterium]
MKKILICSCLFIFGISIYVFASDSQNEKEDGRGLPYTKEIGIISGYAHGNLQEKGSYKIIPVILRLGYSLDSIGLGFCDLIRPLADKLKMKPKGYTGLINEFHLNGVFAPDSNLEAGWTLLIKYSYPVTEKFHPYLIGGGGFGYITQHTREQSMQWGFTPQFGTGFSYFFKKDLALNVEYRRRHFSNANIKRPNGGINVNMFLIGISRFY